MYSGSKFLNDFIARQGRLIQTAVPEPGKKQKKPKHGAAGGDPEFNEKEQFTLLVSEKPSKKVVLEYFKNRIAQLVAEDVT
jgi:hypothetical protein